GFDRAKRPSRRSPCSGFRPPKMPLWVPRTAVSTATWSPSGGLLRMNESIHGERTASEPQDRVTELIEQQTALSEVLRAIASSPRLQPIFDAILDSATRLCRADVGTLRLSEESGLRLVAMRADPLVVIQVWSSLPVLAEKGSIPSRLAAGRLPTHIPDLTALEGDHRDDLLITAAN